MPRINPPVENVAQAILEALRLRGIDYMFGNASTSLLDAFARAETKGLATPKPVIVPHEQVAIAIAHGVYVSTGRMQAACIYSTVGTGNALGAIVNAARARIPMLILATRTALSDRGDVPGARDTHVHWSQESFDQGGMVREFVKWDYELRRPDNVDEVIDRALEMALADPPGPVYLSLPRDVLAMPCPDFSIEAPSRRIVSSRRLPDPDAIEAAAKILAAASNPFIVTAEIGRDPIAAAALVELCDTAAIPVVETSPVYANFPAAHPCHAGYVFGSQVHPGLAEADAILAIECDVPWIPARTALREDTRVVQLGIDPFYAGYPMRNFRCDVPLVADPRSTLPPLTEALRRVTSPTALQARRNRLAAAHARARADWAAAAEIERNRLPIGFQWASRCIADLADETTIVVNEYPLDLRHAPPRRFGSYFGAPHSGGLGWGFGAAVGIKLAHPDRTVIATLGDGSYFFSVPAACHQVAWAAGLPLLTVIFNNGGWDEVVKSTLTVHPDGWAAASNRIPMVRFDPSPRFDRIVSAFGGHGEHVEEPAALPEALARALKAVRERGVQALVNIVCRR
jgi:acetolactate synthase-1/2/3 large subunit